jgi:integrase/recombinase XerC
MDADAGLVERYLEYARVEKRLAARTVELYALDLQRLSTLAIQAQVPLLEVRNAHIRRWVAQMHSAGRSGRGIALILSGWRGFYTWLGRDGLVASNPVQDVRSPKAPKPLPKALGVDDAVQFADFQSDDDPWLEARDTAMVELLYGSGLRVGELVGLDVVASSTARGWVDLQAAQAHVLGKGSKRRIVPVGSTALQALERWLALRGPTGTSQAVPVPAVHADAAAALFTGRNGTRLTPQSVWQRLKRRSQMAGLSTPVHPHMLRHSFASHVLQSSGDLRAVQELLGHANITTTQVYTRLDFQHLAKAYDAAHPRARAKGSKGD